MVGRARATVASLRRSSEGWMPARIGRLSTGVGRKHPVTIRKLMAGPIRWICALRPVFPLRKFYTEQIFFVAHETHAAVQPCRHTNSEAFPTFKRLCDIFIYRTKLRMLEVRENDMTQRKLSGGGTAQLRSCTPYREH